jgi:hypothetical protein
MIENRDIWIFREPRSGSTGVAQFLSKKLNRAFCFVDFMQSSTVDDKIYWNNQPSTECLLNTHEFSYLNDLTKYSDPVILRCTRKNRFEQFLSEVAIFKMNSSFRNIEKDGSTDIEPFLQFTKTKITISPNQVNNFIIKKQKENLLWGKTASLYESHTLYYEDLTGIVDIPPLNLYNIKIESQTERLPDYKKNVFTNYEQVKHWFSFAKNL